MAWQLCSKQDVVNVHPVREEDLQDQWSDMVEGLIRQYMHAPYYGTIITVTDEEHCGEGTTILQVRKPPITAVHSVYVDGLLIAPADYVVFETFVQLRYQVFTRGILNVKISYNSGSVTLSETVKLAAVAMIIALLNYNRRMGADASLKWGVPPDRQVGETSPNQNVGLTSHLEQIMKRTLPRKKARMA